MADNDGKILYSLELDGKQFQDTLDKINAKLGSLEGTSKKAEFPLIIASWAAGLVVFQKSLELAGKVLDQVFEAEKIEKINKSFVNLAASAGIVGKAFQENLVKASGGLIDDTDLIKAANTAMINFGKGAEKLPEILLLARKAVAAGYGELPEIFESLNKAISSGNTKALRQYQIFIDNDKATKQYASSIGATASSLTQAGKQQATLNALLDYSNGKFKNLSTDSGAATDSVTRMKVAFASLFETIQALMLHAAPLVTKFAEAIGGVAKTWKDYIDYINGSTEEWATLRIGTLSERIIQLRKEQEQLVKQMGEGGKNDAYYLILENQIKDANREIEKLSAKRDEMASKGVAVAPEPEAPEVDYGKLKQERSQFENELLTMRQARLDKEIELAMTEEQVVALAGQQVKNIDDQKMLQLEALNLKKQESAMTDQQYADLRVEIEARSAQQIAAVTADLEAKKLNAYQNEVRAATNASGGIAAAFKQGSAQNKAEMASFGAMGQKTYQNFSSKAVSALQELGAGTKSAADVAKGFVLGMLADEAQARGSVLLLSSIWPPNPAGLAAGAGLVALSGALRSMAGGKGSSSGGSLPTGSLNGTGLETAQGSASPNAIDFQQPKKAVTIQVMGSYFETEQTRTRLLEMVREATDATDFKYVQIPGVR